MLVSAALFFMCSGPWLLLATARQALGGFSKQGLSGTRLNCSDTSVQGLSTDSQNSPSPLAQGCAGWPCWLLSSARSQPFHPRHAAPTGLHPSPKSGLRELLCVLQSALQVLSLAGPHARVKSILLLSVFPQSLRCIRQSAAFHTHSLLLYATW